jgi:hypothetical protein
LRLRTRPSSLPRSRIPESSPLPFGGGGYEALVRASALSTPPTQAMLALSPIATECAISAEKLGVIVQVRSPTVIELELTAVTTPVS